MELFMDASNLDLLTQIGSLGIGAVIAVIVLLWKRTDDQRHEQRLEALTEEGNRRFDLLLEISQGTTLALNELRATLGEREAIEKTLLRVERSIDKLRNGET
jgi:hypothetical protein